MDHQHVPDGGEHTVFGRRLGPSDRRNFLKWSGTAAATALLLACDRSPTESASDLLPSEQGAQAGTGGQVTIDLSTDLGILNFAYALEQLEAAFYTKVISDFYHGVSGEEEAILRDIKKHEVIHREFFQAALGGGAIRPLAADFSSVRFGSRDSVLSTARAFEDLGVAAYNGAAQFLRNGDYLEVAGKIVSVEARHASAIRDVLGVSFAPNAFDPAFTFERVLRLADPFLATKVALTHSPTAGQADRTSSQEEMVS